MRLIIVILSAVLLTPTISFAGKWSKYITAIETKGMELSYHYREQNNGWFVEWKAANKGSDWGQPVSQSRTYSCGNGEKVEIKKQGNFGPLPPGESRKVVRDQGICNGSTLEKAEIAVEVRKVPENVKKMYE